MSAQPDGRTPKYRAITTHLVGMIADMAEGDAVPTERELAARFGVSRVTARQAVHELLVAGRLRRQGRGTVVAAPKLTQPLGLGSYTDGLRAMGRRPGRVVVAVDEVRADAALARHLEVAAGDPLARLERVLLADDEPVGLEVTHLPTVRFPDLLADFDASTSLYAHLADTGVVFARATEQIETVLADPREAGLLEVNPSTPMLLLHRTTHDVDDRPVERVRSLFRGDRVSFTSELRADRA